MPLKPHFAVGACLLLASVPANAQTQTAVTSSASTPPSTSTASSELRSEAAVLSTDIGVEGTIPARRGFNVTLGNVSQHDSSAGWQNILTPTVAWRFNSHWSAFATVPVYPYIPVSDQVGTTPATKTTPATPIYGLRTHHFLLGDTVLAGQFETPVGDTELSWSAIGSLGVPTGDDAHGLGAGQPTYSFNNRFERPLTAWLEPGLELGLSDSSNLDDLRARRSYTTVGTKAHFAFGFSFSLPRGMSFSAEAFEELPLTSQTVTSTTTNGKKGKQQKTITTTSQKSFGEDNGFETSLDIPLSRHLTLSGLYDRSLRNKTDTAGFGLTFLLRPNQSNSDVH